MMTTGCKTHDQCMQFGIANGWWPDYNDKGPLDFPRIVRRSALPHGARMSHAIFAAGFASSVSDARRNGWDKPLQGGVHIIDKMQHRIKIVLD